MDINRKIFTIIIISLVLCMGFVNIFTIESKANGIDFSEDFDVDEGIWTEYDPNDKILLDHDEDQRLEFNNWKRSDPSYIYKSYTTQDFVLEYEIMITDSSGNGNMVGPGFSDTLDFIKQAQNGIYVVYYTGFQIGTPRLCIITIVDGEWEQGWGGNPPQPNRININLDTEYYIKFVKTEGTLTLNVFSDPARTNHIPGSPKIIETSLTDMNFNYFYAVSTPYVGNWELTSGWIDNLNICPTPNYETIYVDDDADPSWYDANHVLDMR